MKNEGTEIKAVVFDLGGVLEYDSRLQVDSHLARSFGITLRKLQQLLPPLTARLQKGEIDEKQMWKEFAKEVGKTIPPNWKTLLREPHAKHFHLLKGTLQIVRELKKKGFKLGLLSNTQQAHARKEHAKRTFPQFDFVFLSHRQGLVKPDKRAYTTVLHNLKVKAKETVYIDNVRKYVTAANKVGMRGVLFKNAAQLRKALQEMKVLDK